MVIIKFHLLPVLILLGLMAGSVPAEALTINGGAVKHTVNQTSFGHLTYNSTVAGTNLVQFKTNLDRAMEFMINIYRGAYGGIGGLWFVWSYIALLSAFYYSFGVIFLNAKDDAKAEFDKNNEIPHERSLGLSHIDVNTIFSSLKGFQEKASSHLGDACYQRSSCEVKTYFATTRFYNWIPGFIRRILNLSPISREAGTCRDLHPDCNWQSLIFKLVASTISPKQK